MSFVSLLMISAATGANRLAVLQLIFYHACSELTNEIA